MTTENKLLLVEYFYDCGRMGELEGLFVCTEDELNKAIDLEDEVYWGEVLGKHSEVYHTLTAQDLRIVSEDQEFIRKLQEVLKVESTISGFNPVERILESVEDEE